MNDAVLFREWLIDPDGGGLDPAHVALFTSPEDGSFAPSRDVIEDQILQTFYQKRDEGVRPVGRRLYLFMAGHGVAPADGDDCSLIAANSFLNSLRVLSGRMAADRIRKQPMFQEVVLFMACCRDVGVNASVYCNLPPPGETLNKKSTYLHGLAVKWDKKALEQELPHPTDPKNKPKLWQSVFSYALLQGLRSAFDDDGQITSLSLKRIVKEHVMRLLPPDNNTPPEFFLDEDNLIVFKSRPSAAPVAGRVASPPPPPGGPPPAVAGAEPAAALERALPRTRGGGRLRRSVAPAQPAVAPPPAGLTPVNITLSGGATVFETLDGETLAALNPPVETVAAATFRVFLKPSLYAFRVPGREAKPVSVLGEAISVEL
ncbi:hypothetical protein [Bradyrhizobium sp.]|uniref:hypothetical protein n=1 Tax=Bradyrhizobium sp. TaxID=376 RepID=UPI002DF8BBF9|nr:hypothetical protein [Bradyrhizobium sp.]